jgi:flagellar motor switch protein FliN/FliY
MIMERRDLSNRPFTQEIKEMNMHTNNVGTAQLMEERGNDGGSPFHAAPGGSSPQVFEQLNRNSSAKTEIHNDIDMIMDIPVQLTVQLGRTKIAIKNLLQLAQGSVVELDGLAGEPMDVLVNGYLIAQGEVVVVNDKFGIRLTDIITPSERIRKLNR